VAAETRFVKKSDLKMIISCFAAGNGLPRRGFAEFGTALSRLIEDPPSSGVQKVKLPPKSDLPKKSDDPAILFVTPWHAPRCSLQKSGE